MCFLSEAQIFVACISQQGQSIIKRRASASIALVSSIFSHTTSSFLQIGCIYLEKTLRYGLERLTKGAHSKRGPILMNTD